MYLDYARGYNLTNRMPLWIKPNHLLDVKEVIKMMRDHYEGTWFDFSTDVGAGPFNAPYRVRPLEWNYNGNSYVNERSISIQQTASTFVAQMRSNLPSLVGGVLWFGVDDSGMTVHAPIYCGINGIPPSLDEKLADIVTFSFDSAFWVFNLVSNWVYTRYNLIYPEVLDTILTLEAKMREESVEIEKRAEALLLAGDVENAVELLTEFSVNTYEDLVKYWLKYFQFLFVKYSDGVVKTKTGNPKEPNVASPGYEQAWEGEIVKETGDRYKAAPSSGLLKSRPFTNRKV